MDLELSDNQRRFVCRILFLALCLAPTAFVAYAALHQKSAHHWAESIQAEIGLPTRIGLVRTPLPGKLILKDFAIHSPDGKEILSALQANVDLDRRRVQIEGPVAVTPEGLYHLVTEASERILGAGQGDSRWSFEFANLNIVRSKGDAFLTPFDNSVQLSPAWVEIAPVPNGRRVVLTSRGQSFEGGDPDSEWLVLSIDKDFRDNQIDLVLFCPDNRSLPVWLVPPAASRDIEKVVGPNAKFTGNVSVANLADQPAIKANGTFLDVQLPDRSSHELGIVSVKDVRILDSQWIDGRAWLVLPGSDRIALDNLTMPSTTATTQMLQAIRQATWQSEISRTNHR